MIKVIADERSFAVAEKAIAALEAFLGHMRRCVLPPRNVLDCVKFERRIEIEMNIKGDHGLFALATPSDHFRHKFSEALRYANRPVTVVMEMGWPIIQMPEAEAGQ